MEVLSPSSCPWGFSHGCLWIVSEMVLKITSLSQIAPTLLPIVKSPRPTLHSFKALQQGWVLDVAVKSFLVAPLTVTCSLVLQLFDEESGNKTMTTKLIVFTISKRENVDAKASSFLHVLTWVSSPVLVPFQGNSGCVSFTSPELMCLH